MNLLKYGLNQWKNPDYNVRLEYAQRSNNQKKLIYLAINDVHESVRLASVKNLRSDALRLNVIEFSSCDRSVELAQRFVESDEARCEIALMETLNPSLRLAAIQAVSRPREALIIELASDCDESLALYAIATCEDGEALEVLYSEELSDARCLAILSKIQSQALALHVFESSIVRERRIAALMKITCADKLKELYLHENDGDIRLRIIQCCDDDTVLVEFFEDEDDELIRAKIAGLVSDDTWLASVATNDYNLEVRRSAAQSLSDESLLVDVALGNEDVEIHKVIFEKQLEDQALLRIALHSVSPRARVEAISKVNDSAQLVSVFHETKFPDAHWFAARRIGELPMQSLRKIQSSELLLRTAKEDPHKLVRIAAMRQIKDAWAMNQLANSTDQELSAVATALLKEVIIPSGLRFLRVPERSYQLSIFPVTGEQFAHWKDAISDSEAADRYRALEDLPVTDISIDEAQEFCSWLGTQDQGRYRLPYFHEWKHAAVCDSPEWFSTGRLRAFVDSEQSELVLFGQERRARPMHQAVPNPWGLLDMIGSVMEWANDVPISEQVISANIPLDEFAQVDSTDSDVINLKDFAYASGNHWADRRIRSGRWKRLIHRDNISGKAVGKVGFRVLRFDPTVRVDPIEYELTLLPGVAVGYTEEQVCWALSRALVLDFEDLRRRYAVTPSRIVVTRDYSGLVKLKNQWESCGALTKLVSTGIERANRDA